jgi:hypothetical protein
MPDPKILLLALCWPSPPLRAVLDRAGARAPARGPLSDGWHTLVGFITDFPRHARHRIVRGDDDDLPAVAMVPGPEHPGHAQRRHAVPTVAQALIYITIVRSDSRRLRR